MSKTKDIYEHLAKVYFDSTRNKKSQALPKSIFKNLFIITASLVVCLVFVLMVVLIQHRQESRPQSQVVFILEASPTRINYDFTQVEKETATFDLKDISLLDFRTLSFRIRKSNFPDNLHMSVEFVSKYGENSQIYIKQIPTRWQDLKIKLAEFENISDWSHMSQLSFVLEEWNAQVKQGIVYIDNIQFLK